MANSQANGAGSRGKAWPLVAAVMEGSQRLEPVPTTVEAAEEAAVETAVGPKEDP